MRVSCLKKMVGLLMIWLVFAEMPVYASPPSSGAVLEGAKPPPAMQQPTVKGPTITVVGQQPQNMGDGQEKFSVKRFRLSGELPLPEGELLDLIRGECGKEITLDKLNLLAQKITKHLRQMGYLVAFAYIPAQEIKDGIVEIAVMPGKYGQIKITGKGHFSHDRLKSLLHAAKPGNIISRKPLERALLNLSDLSGITVNATLAPGATGGSADLILNLVDTAKVRSVVYMDNWGNRYTSKTRLGVQISVANLDGYGSEISLGGLIGENNRMTNYNIGYGFLWGNDGGRFSVRHSRVNYVLGENFADLGATGQATVTSGEVKYPLIRSRAFSLYGTFAYEEKNLHDDQTATDSYVPKKSSALSIGLFGNFDDTWMGGGSNSYSLNHYRGQLSILDASTKATDATTAETAGNFAKTVLTFQRQQYLAKNLSFHLNFTGQLADKNLDSSEKFFLGGADGVRAFPQGEAAGDDGYKLTGEVRWRLPGLSSPKDNVYLAGFYDYGSVRINHQMWAGAGDSNSRSLMGAGLGILWVRSSDFAIRLDCAWKVGNEKATADTDANSRIWLQGIKYF